MRGIPNAEPHTLEDAQKMSWHVEKLRGNTLGCGIKPCHQYQHLSHPLYTFKSIGVF